MALQVRSPGQKQSQRHVGHQREKQSQRQVRHQREKQQSQRQVRQESEKQRQKQRKLTGVLTAALTAGNLQMEPQLRRPGLIENSAFVFFRATLRLLKIISKSISIYHLARHVQKLELMAKQFAMADTTGGDRWWQWR